MAYIGGDRISFILPFENFDNALIGIGYSNVRHLPLKITHVEGLDHDDPVRVQNTHTEVLNLPASSITTLIDASSEAVLCSCACTVAFSKADDDGYLDCFVTAGHSGTLTFWKIPILDIAPVIHKKVTPETFMKLKVFIPASVDNLALKASAVVTTMQFNASSLGRRPMLLLGYDDGVFEVLKLSVSEYDDDESSEG